jgi:hypothetical protein
LTFYDRIWQRNKANVADLHCCAKKKQQNVEIICSCDSAWAAMRLHVAFLLPQWPEMVRSGYFSASNFNTLLMRDVAGKRAGLAARRWEGQVVGCSVR